MEGSGEMYTPAKMYGESGTQSVLKLSRKGMRGWM